MKRHPMIGRVALALAFVAGISVAVRADIITNGSFESDPALASGYYYRPSNIGGWAFTSTSGAIRPPSAFAGPNPAADGIQYAFLQTNIGDSHSTDGSVGQITQTITLPQDGTYWLTLQQASRESDFKASYAVQLDSTTIGTGSASSQAFKFTSFQFTGTAGPHMLSLVSTGLTKDSTTGLPIDSTTFLDNLAIKSDVTTGFFTRPFSGDTDSGISASKNYTHAINFNGPAIDINGVQFSEGTTGVNSSLKYELANTPDGFGGLFVNNLSGAINALAQNFFYDGGDTETLTLTGLTPDTTYRATFYNVGFGSPRGRVMDVSDSLGGSLSDFDQNYSGDGNGNLLIDTYTTAASGPNSTSITFYFDPRTGDSFHQYGFTNEVVPEPSTLALLGLGSLGLAAFAWRRRRA